MSAKPAQVCILEKDKLIDAQKGFVDTFNWVASFCANLEGKDGITVDKAVSDHPVVKLGVEDDKDDSGDSGSTYNKYQGWTRVIGTDGSSNMTDDEYNAATDPYNKPYTRVPVIRFHSATDSNVKATVTGDPLYASVKIGVYYA